MPRKAWKDVADYAPRFAQADFDPERCFFAERVRDPTRTDIPTAQPRMRFPFPPEEMDVFVSKAVASKAMESAAAEAAGV